MTDKIEKQVVLKAPRARVWRAISDKTEFGTWFGISFPAGKFAAGDQASGKLTNRGYEHLILNIDIVEVVPEKRLSYRWHPYALDPKVDYSSEPKTLVTFTLDDAPGGTKLTIVESGFDQIPAHRRAEAYKMNDGGWTSQVRNIERHVSA